MNHSSAPTADRRDRPHGCHVGSQARPYLRLAVSLAVSFVVMYIVMYARVRSFDHVYLGLNQAYMAGLMVAPMLLVMLATMSHMYTNRPANIALAVLGVGLVALFLFLIRSQAGIDDRQFLRSMIPHHSGAILVCQEAGLRAAATTQLCREIIESQEAEIREMKALLAE